MERAPSPAMTGGVGADPRPRPYSLVAATVKVTLAPAGRAGAVKVVASAARSAGGPGTPSMIVVTRRPVMSGGGVQRTVAESSVDTAPTSLGAAGGAVRKRLSAVFQWEAR